jgi:hypothetical protein
LVSTKKIAVPTRAATIVKVIFIPVSIDYLTTHNGHGFDPPVS